MPISYEESEGLFASKKQRGQGLFFSRRCGLGEKILTLRAFFVELERFSLVTFFLSQESKDFLEGQVSGMNWAFTEQSNSAYLKKSIVLIASGGFL